MWHVTCDMWYVTHDIWHMTRDIFLGRWTFSQNFSTLAFIVCDLWYYEDLEEKADGVTESINQLINDEAVYGTAPATLGLLLIFNIDQKAHYAFNQRLKETSWLLYNFVWPVGTRAVAAVCHGHWPRIVCHSEIQWTT